MPVYTVKDVQDRAWNQRFYLFPIALDELNRNEKLVQILYINFCKK